MARVIYRARCSPLSISCLLLFVSSFFLFACCAGDLKHVLYESCACLSVSFFLFFVFLINTLLRIRMDTIVRVVSVCISDTLPRIYLLLVGVSSSCVHLSGTSSQPASHIHIIGRLETGRNMGWDLQDVACHFTLIDRLGAYIESMVHFLTTAQESWALSFLFAVL